MMEVGMKKFKFFFHISLLIFFLELFGIICVSFSNNYNSPFMQILKVSCVLFSVWIIATGYICIKKSAFKKNTSKILTICNTVFFVFFIIFSILCVLHVNTIHTENFFLSTPLFEDKNVMIIVPHQDDDINIAGGLIEQYTNRNSDVTVVFSTNGDNGGIPEIRASEAVDVLTSLGVAKNNIYYLGFGDQWNAQICDGESIKHIYNSTEPDSIWTSNFGSTATYGTKSINCYLSLPYTRNNFVYSLQEIIQEKMPDIIFAVDFDSHIDHKATGLLFEEAICNVLKLYPAYNPTVYKGFCYGTAWLAVPDYYDNINLMSTKKPDSKTWENTSFSYNWEDRVRFPVSKSARDKNLLNNSVCSSLYKYNSQSAISRFPSVLNGDKVFWERRTDSLLYNAEIFVDDQKTTLLNDFKLKDFRDIGSADSANVGVEHIKNKKVHIKTDEQVKANVIYMYDNPDKNENILKGYISFSDGSKINFGELNKDGSPTKISFPDKQISWMKIIPTELEGNFSGLSEIELYYDPFSAQVHGEEYLMAVDEDDNFVYDYVTCNKGTLKFRLYSFPHRRPLNENDVNLTLDSMGSDVSYYWDGYDLIIKCPKGYKCNITVVKESLSTTFSVSNLSNMRYLYLRIIQSTGRTVMMVKHLGLLVMRQTTELFRIN